MCRRRRDETGFTLVEMTVVLLLLAAILSIVLPNVTSLFGAPSSHDAARRLTDALAEARAEAIATRKSVRFSLGGDRRSWRYAGRTGGAGGTALSISAAPLGRAPTIVFFPDGGSTGGRVSVGAGGDRRVIAVGWLDGRIAVTAE
ncbi:MAG: GspH/FimT family pseudopilin [Alphaproteobacteria bacterium]